MTPTMKYMHILCDSGFVVRMKIGAAERLVRFSYVIWTKSLRL